MTSRIEDYAMIGDCQTAALVGTRRLDRLAVLAALRFRRLLRGAPRHAGSRPLADRAARRRGPRHRRYRDRHADPGNAFRNARGRRDAGRFHAAARQPFRTSSASWSASAGGSRCAPS